MVPVSVRAECEDQNNEVSGMMEGEMKNQYNEVEQQKMQKRWLATSWADQELCFASTVINYKSDKSGEK